MEFGRRSNWSTLNSLLIEKLANFAVYWREYTLLFISTASISTARLRFVSIWELFSKLLLLRRNEWYIKKVLILISILNIYLRGRAGQKFRKMGSKLSTSEPRKRFAGAYKKKRIYRTKNAIKHVQITLSEIKKDGSKNSRR